MFSLYLMTLFDPLYAERLQRLKTKMDNYSRFNSFLIIFIFHIILLVLLNVKLSLFSCCSLWRRPECSIGNYLVSELPQLVPAQPGVSLAGDSARGSAGNIHHQWPTTGRVWYFLRVWLCWGESLHCFITCIFLDDCSLCFYSMDLIIVLIEFIITF